MQSGRIQRSSGRSANIEKVSYCFVFVLRISSGVLVSVGEWVQT